MTLSSSFIRTAPNAWLSRRSLLGSTSAALLLAGLSACGPGSSASGGETSAPSSAPGGAPADVPMPEGWTWVEGAEAPTAQAAPSLPVTVTDGTGEEVEVTDISRIIAGGEDVADILAAMGLGDKIHAAPENSVAEAAVNAPEHFEFSQNTGTEGLLSVDGTLFIGNNVQRHGDVAAQFRSAGVAAVVVDDQQPVADKIRAVGAYVGDTEAGDELAAQVEAQLADAAQSVEGTSVSSLKVLAITSSGAGGADAVIGSGTAVADILAATGAVNVGVEEGLRGYSVKFSGEGLLSAMPDVVLTGGGDLQQWNGIEGFSEAFPTLAQTPALESGTVIVMPSEQIKVSGASVGVGAVALAEALAAIAQ